MICIKEPGAYQRAYCPATEWSATVAIVSAGTTLFANSAVYSQVDFTPEATSTHSQSPCRSLRGSPLLSKHVNGAPRIRTKLHIHSGNPGYLEDIFVRRMEVFSKRGTQMTPHHHIAPIGTLDEQAHIWARRTYKNRRSCT